MPVENPDAYGTIEYFRENSGKSQGRNISLQRGNPGVIYGINSAIPGLDINIYGVPVLP